MVVKRETTRSIESLLLPGGPSYKLDFMIVGAYFKGENFNFAKEGRRTNAISVCIYKVNTS